MKDFKKFFKYYKEHISINDILLNLFNEKEIDKVKYLLKNGADIETKNEWGYTLLNWWSSKGFLEGVKFLVKSGADVNTVDKLNFSPLMNACLKEKKETIKFLVKSGADLNILNNRGDNCLQILLKQYYQMGTKDIETFKILIDGGIDIYNVNKNGKDIFDINREYFRLLDVQKILLENDPFSINLFKKHGITLHEELKDKYYDLDLGSELGTI